jgi:glycosyltransferase involved in cell wall biosynthesis
VQGQTTVSVVVPCFNRTHLVPAAVRSAVEQALDGVEVIVVDDGSPEDVASAVAGLGERVRYLRTDHGGAAHARNAGLRAARGKYVAFLDSDDLYLPGKLALQVAFMEAHPGVGMVSTEVSSFDGTRVLEERHLRSYHGAWSWAGLSYEDVYPTRGIFAWQGREVPCYEGDIFAFVLRGSLVMSTTVLFRRELLDRVGLQNESYRYAQDYEFVVRLCKHGRAAFLDVPTYLIRYHEGQHSMYQGAGARGRRRARLPIEIAAETVALRAVLDWGCGDPEYHEANRGWLDRRVAEVHHNIGLLWLSLGDAAKARESFRAGIERYAPYRPNRVDWWWSFVPSLPRRGISWAWDRTGALLARSRPTPAGRP